MAEPQDIRRAIDRSPLLADVPEGPRARLAAAARRVRYAAGAPIFRRGDAGEGMLLVLDGLVRLHLSTPAGREMTIGLAGAGEPVGEIALIDGEPRSADATALTPVAALLLRHAEAKAILREEPELALALLRTLAARIRRTTDQAEAVALQPLPQRLAGALLRLAAVDPSGLVRQSQSQIAALVAASRPKVNLALSELRDRGLVEQARVGLRLADPDGLRKLAGQG
ncbi:Crp/Fnr family transcriptional regulator [Roseococcus sp. SYP-B2431]|uniref:Crp/Fnr family transcriptional regulator n=1 Tax=Roseococcus sp. SYP-B2431 TaxID=2496640 RepID=UPI00103ACD22|nr:Crp/Fnr family transcriptional regulator [Roseococcus sp. SYP-B2431]TCH98231.1 Crp/Fnr family transcriptional regulator [Roseococcus sp. SYP-B2431]